MVLSIAPDCPLILLPCQAEVLTAEVLTAELLVTRTGNGKAPVEHKKTLPGKGSARLIAPPVPGNFSTSKV
jgi:hypothetical protein